MPHKLCLLMKRFIFLLLLAALGGPVQAAGYQVEIIIFEHLSRDADDEVSQTGLNLPDFSNSVELTDASGDGEFRILSPGVYKLGGVYSELKASGNYRPVLHTAWAQPQHGQAGARYVHIRKSGDGAAPEASIKFDGVIRIRSAQFLHADVDLFYFVDALSESFIQANAAGENSSQIRANQIQASFAELRETRRMKLNELHYFDHPLFGLFMRVSRLNTE